MQGAGFGRRATPFSSTGNPACANVTTRRYCQCLVRSGLRSSASMRAQIPNATSKQRCRRYLVFGYARPSQLAAQAGMPVLLKPARMARSCQGRLPGTACRAPTVALVGVALVWRGLRRCWCWRRGRAWRLFLRRGLRRSACRLRRWASPSRRMRGNLRSAWARRPIRVRRRVRSPRAGANLKFRGRNGRAPTSCRLRR